MDYERLKIKSYKHWDLYLHENQCYLGRVFVLLKDEKGWQKLLALLEKIESEETILGASAHIMAIGKARKGTSL